MTSGRPLELGERGADLRGELAVGDQRLRFAVLQDVGDGRGIEPRVDGVEHRAQHGHAVVGIQHGRHVGQHGRHGVARPDAAARKRRSKPQRALMKRAVAVALGAMDHRYAVGVDGGRPRQERNRREACEIRRIGREAREQAGLCWGLSGGAIGSPGRTFGRSVGSGAAGAHLAGRNPARPRLRALGRRRFLALFCALGHG